MDKYLIQNLSNNEWLTKYNSLITANAKNTKSQKTPKHMRIIPPAINDNISSTDENNYVWLSEKDAATAKKYLWKYNHYFALPFWLAISGKKELKAALTSSAEFEQLRKDTADVKAKRITYVENIQHIYLANGLFCTGDRMVNELIYSKLIKSVQCSIYVPQKNLAINDKTKSASSLPIYDGDTAELEKADIIIAVLDGQDLGVATEVGWVAGWNAANAGKAKPKKLVGIFTDNRNASTTASKAKNDDMVKCGVAESQYPYINLYTIGAIKKYGVVVNDIDSAIEYIKTLL